jgi:succinate dehydrogenase/fumarate reductase-like Fe-S protein
MSTPKVRITIMDKRYEVPQGLTILNAYEYAGYQLVRGVGCRGGVCGACATVYRMEGEFRRRSCLACQTEVMQGMILAPIHSYPTNRPAYDVAKIGDPRRAVVDLFPEVQKCLGCNACNKICPQSIDVMGYVAAIIAGDLEKASDLSFDCILCGMCATTCPAEISQHNAALLARRVYARHLVQGSENVRKRTAELRAGTYTADLQKLASSSEDELKKLYAAREVKR